MKKLFIITVFIAGFTWASQAQNSSADKQETTKESRKRMRADLNLSSDQAKQLKDLNEEFKGKAKTIKENQSLSKEQKKEQFTSLQRERSEKMNAFLTPEQQSKIRSHKKAGKHHKRPAA